MKMFIKFFSFLLFIITSLDSHEQDFRLVYIQSENKKPFYVKLQDKVVSSSNSGFLIIPKLSEGEYRFRLGFPGDTWPEQDMNFKVDSKDEGLILKNYPENGWGLINIRSAQITMHKEIVKEILPAREIKTDVFSSMLALVVNDSTIMEKDVAAQVKLDTAMKSNVVISETIHVLANNTADIAETKEVTPFESKTESVQEKTEGSNSSQTTISKTMEKKSNDGVDLIYVVGESESKDTIRLFIPLPSGAQTTNSVAAPIIASSQNITTVTDPTAEAVNTSVSGVNIPEASTNEGKEEKLSRKERKRREKAAEKKADVPVDNSLSKSSTLNVSLEKIDSNKVKSDRPDNPVSKISEPTFIEDQPVVKPKKERRKKIKEPLLNEQINTSTATIVDSVKSDLGLVESSPDKSEELTAANGATSNQPVKQAAVMINSDCKKLASDEDYLKLRKKLGGMEDNDLMIEAARKIFKTRCFTTQQLKKLSVLFLNDAGRYGFFDAAYPFLYDSDNVKELETQLSDSYYIARFKAMIKK